MALLYHYETCSTSRAARRWLEAKKIPFTLRPIVDEPPTAAELRRLWERSGLPLARFFNTSGLSYRALPNRDELPTMSDDSKLRLLAADGKLIRRPILEDGGTVLVGFDEAKWAAWSKC
jgi:arsenate reductase